MFEQRRLLSPREAQLRAEPFDVDANVLNMQTRLPFPFPSSAHLKDLRQGVCVCVSALLNLFE